MHVWKPAEAVRKKRGSKVWVVFVGVTPSCGTIKPQTYQHKLGKPGGRSAEANPTLEATCEHRVRCPDWGPLSKNMRPPTLA